tara:strand:- start:446 stop:832 length:387 start_codon:yes stop_codon:yes gene_type:complete
MSDKFTVEIISPDDSILKTETSEVVIPSYEGEMGILKNHIPLITFLRPGKIIIKENKEEFFVEEGTVEFVDNVLLILTSTAKAIIDVNKSLFEDIISKSEKKISDIKITDKEKYLLSYKINTLKSINL